MSKQLIARDTARQLGEKLYFTGKPCVRGHISERRVSNALCVECQAEYGRAWSAENPDKVRLSNKKWASKNPSKQLEYSKRYKDKNQQEISQRAKEKYLQDHERQRQRAIDWHRNNPEKSNTISVRRRAQKLNATPTWDSCLTDFVMHEAFDLSKRREAVTGFAWHVDHMIPLKARSACGLHTWSNLQVIPAVLNISKKNRLVLTSPGEWIGAL